MQKWQCLVSPQSSYVWVLCPKNKWSDSNLSFTLCSAPGIHFQPYSLQEEGIEKKHNSNALTIPTRESGGAHICIQTYPTVECKQTSLKSALELPIKHFLGGGTPHTIRLIQLFFKLTLIFFQKWKTSQLYPERRHTPQRICLLCLWEKEDPPFREWYLNTARPTVQSPCHNDSVLFTPYFFSSLGDRAGQEG